MQGITRDGQGVDHDGLVGVGVHETGGAGDQAGPYPARVVGRGEHDQWLLGQEGRRGGRNLRTDHQADANSDLRLAHAPLHFQFTGVVGSHGATQKNPQVGAAPLGAGALSAPLGA